jgi:hypothetical protein
VSFTLKDAKEMGELLRRLKYLDPSGGGGGSGSLAGLSDVALTSPADADVLTYVAADTKWKNKPAAGGGGGGELVLLDHATVATGTIISEGWASLSSYSAIRLVWRGLRVTNSHDNIQALFRASGADVTSSSHRFAGHRLNSSGSASDGSSTGISYLALTDISADTGPGTGAECCFDGESVIFHPESTAFHKMIRTWSQVKFDTGNVSIQECLSYLPSAGAINGIRAFTDTGNTLTAGDLYVYGIKKT